MSYLGFARKYRPQLFSEVVGQEHIATTLRNAIESNRIHHAYLFCGSRGVGKTSMARILSKAINCQNGPTIVPCNQCTSCLSISQGEDMDVLEIDGASNRGIEEIRNIKDNIKYHPSQSRFKIFIIDEVHMLTQAAFNALLKTIEEPPSYAKFIFATTHFSAIPDTISSRCQRFDFKKISISDITSQLAKIAKKEEIEVSEDILIKVAGLAGGALRDSLVLFDQLTVYGGKSIQEENLLQIIGGGKNEPQILIEAIAKRNVNQVLETIDTFFDQGGDPAHLIEAIAQKLRDLLIFSVSREGQKFIDNSDSYFDWLKKLSPHFTPEFIIQAIHHVIESKKHIQRDLMGRIILETLFLKIIRIESLLALKPMIERLEKLETRILSGTLSPGQPVAYSPQPSTYSPPENRSGSYSSPPSQQNFEEVPSSVLAGMEKTTGTLSKKNSLVPNTSAPNPVLNNTRSPLRENGLENGSGNRPKSTQKKTLPPIDPSKLSPPELWNFFLDEFSRHKDKTASFLRQEAELKIEGHSWNVILKAEHEIILNLVNSERDLIQNLSRKILGDKIKLNFQLAKGKKVSLEEGKALEKAKENPLVYHCIELFGGRILGVERVEN